MVKAAGGPGCESDHRVVTLQNRIAYVDQFANVRKIAKTDPEQMIQVCEEMLATPGIETAVQIGDVFAQMVEHYVESRLYPEAHGTVERMRQRGIILTPYLDRNVLETIYSAVGMPVPESEPSQSAPRAPEAPEMDEEIEEEN